jgi:DNA primase
MSIPPRFVQELRDRVSLSEVIGKRIKVTRTGREFKACCPFHQEKTPSFTINDDKQFYHCFGCGAHGDAVGFVMRYENLSFVEAVENLAAQAGMSVPQQSPQEIERAKQEKSLYGLMDDAARWFEDNLFDTKNREVLNYLLGRGLREDTIRNFRLGYAPAENFSESKIWLYLKSKGYTEQQLLSVALLKPSQKNQNSYSFFRDRLMFPVSDSRGRIVAFGGRILPEHLSPLKDPANKPPKYINSADNPLFHKGQTLYAIQHARVAANSQELLVVEGYMDVIACHQAGFAGAVAPLGTALTEEQILLLWKLNPNDLKEPIICFDGDQAGYRAALRAADRLIPILKPNHSAKFVFLPQGQDPDSFIKDRGRDSFQQFLSQAQSLIDFLWSHHTEGKLFSTPEQQAGLGKIFDDLTSRIPDRQVQYLYRQAFREKCRNLFRATSPTQKYKSQDTKGGGLRPVLNKPSAPLFKPSSQTHQQSRQIFIQDVMSLALKTQPQIYFHISDILQQIKFQFNEPNPLFQALLDFFSDCPEESLATLDKNHIEDHLKSLNLQDFWTQAHQQNLHIHAGFVRPQAELEPILMGLKQLWADYQKNQLKDDLKQAQSDFRHNFTPDNERRLYALSQLALKIDQDIEDDSH